MTALALIVVHSRVTCVGLSRAHRKCTYPVQEGGASALDQSPRAKLQTDVEIGVFPEWKGKFSEFCEFDKSLKYEQVW